jgi:hypothetical protein
VLSGLRPGAAPVVGAALADGTPIIAVPVSPVRRAELALVTLGTSDRPRGRSTRRPPALATRRRALLSNPLLPPTIASGSALTVSAGHAQMIELAKGQSAKGRVQLSVDPRQVVRAIFLGAYGRVTGDLQIRGQGTAATPVALAIPPATRRLAIIGESPDAPQLGPRTDGPQEPMGIEGSTLTLALEGGTFAAHGCVVRVEVGPGASARSLSALPGRRVLDGARNLSVAFAAPLRGTAVVLLRAVQRVPAPAVDQVRWRSTDAAFGAASVVTAGPRAALLIPVSARGVWSLGLEVGPDYCLEGIIALASDPAAVKDQLSRSSSWVFLDDQWTVADGSAPVPQPERIALAHLELLS